MHRLIGLRVEKTPPCHRHRSEARFFFSEKQVACNATRSLEVPTKYSAISKCTSLGSRRSPRNLERAWAMFRSGMVGASFQKMGIKTLAFSILPKKTTIFTSFGHHLSGIWRFNLRFFITAHLPVSPRRSVII